MMGELELTDSFRGARDDESMNRRASEPFPLFPLLCVGRIIWDHLDFSCKPFTRAIFRYRESQGAGLPRRIIKLRAKTLPPDGRLQILI